MSSLSEVSKSNLNKVDEIDIKKFLGSNELLLLSYLHNYGAASYPLIFRKVSELAVDMDSSDEVIYLTLRVYEYLSQQVISFKSFQLAIITEDGSVRVRARSNNIKDLQQYASPFETKLLDYSPSFEFGVKVLITRVKVFLKSIKRTLSKPQ